MQNIKDNLSKDDEALSVEFQDKKKKNVPWSNSDFIVFLFYLFAFNMLFICFIGHKMQMNKKMPVSSNMSYFFHFPSNSFIIVSIIIILLN